MVGSKSFNLSRTDWAKVGKGAVIAGAGAGCFYLLEYFQAIPEGVTEAWTPLAVAVLSVVVNFLRKLAVDNT